MGATGQVKLPARSPGAFPRVGGLIAVSSDQAGWFIRCSAEVVR